MKIYKEIVGLILAVVLAIVVFVAFITMADGDNKATVDGVSPRIIETRESLGGE